MDILRGGWAPGLLGNGAGLRADSPSTGGYATESEAIFAAFTTPPTTGRKDLIDAAVVALKGAGVWTKLDALYTFAAADSQAAKINWKAPGTFNATEVNAPAFAADLGFTGASTKYIDTSFNATTAPSPKFVRDDASLFVWSNTSAVIAGAGLSNGGNLSALYPRYSDGSRYVGINSTAINAVTIADGSGLLAASRVSSTSIPVYKNGASLAPITDTSTAPANINFFFLLGPSNSYTGQIAGGGFGQSLNSTEHTALYNALRTYMTGVGVP